MSPLCWFQIRVEAALCWSHSCWSLRRGESVEATYFIICLDCIRLTLKVEYKVLFKSKFSEKNMKNCCCNLQCKLPNSVWTWLDEINFYEICSKEKKKSLNLLWKMGLEVLHILLHYITSCYISTTNFAWTYLVQWLSCLFKFYRTLKILNCYIYI